MSGRGSIELVCGPMFAGKSTEISRQVARLEEAGKGGSAVLLVPGCDVRRGVGILSTHDGASLEAVAISAPQTLPEHVRYVVLDEIQFLDTDRFDGDAVAWIASLRDQGRSVLAAGLDRDWKGAPFRVVDELSRQADRVLRLRARCARCGGPATRTWRPDATGGIFALGGEGDYEPLCVEHWEEEALRAGIPLPVEPGA